MSVGDGFLGNHTAAAVVVIMITFILEVTE